MKSWLLCVTVGLLISMPLCAAEPIEILAIGASQTNGRGLPPTSSYPAQLEGLLRSDRYDVVVKNSGIDGDTSNNIYRRMTSDEVSGRTKIVILEQSGNDLNKSGTVEYYEKALGWLQERHIPTVFMSNRRIQTDDEARSSAEKFGAIYYGSFFKGVPRDNEHVQQGEFFIHKNKVDYHLTALGYEVIARNMLPIIEKIITENHLGEPKVPTQ